MPSRPAAAPPGDGAAAHTRPQEPGAFPDVEQLSFEQAVVQLEDIIDRIESGEIGLEESLLSYQRGEALVRRCRALLARADQIVSELTPPPSSRAPRPQNDPEDGR